MAGIVAQTSLQYNHGEMTDPATSPPLKPAPVAESIDRTPLKPRFGSLYLYRLIQPVSIHSEGNDLLLDLGFMIYRRAASIPGGAKLKEGDIAESKAGKTSYRLVKSKKTEADLFTYKAFVEHVVDGDTLRVKIDLGFDTWTRQYLRLRGLNAPEIGTADGQKALEFVNARLKDAPFILLTSTHSDKYDRYLSDIFVPKPKLPFAGAVRLEDYEYLNNELLLHGHAVRMKE